MIMIMIMIIIIIIIILQVDSVFETFDQFFNLRQEVKAKYAKKKMTVQNVNPQNGWDAVETERSVILGDFIWYLHSLGPLRSFEFYPLRKVKFLSPCKRKKPIADTLPPSEFIDRLRHHHSCPLRNSL